MVSPHRRMTEFVQSRDEIPQCSERPDSIVDNQFMLLP